MKKWMIVLGVFLLVGFTAYPAFARGCGGGCPGWGPGAGQGSGPGYCWRNQGASPSLTPEQQQKLNSLNEKFFNETSTLRNNIWQKQNQMTLLLNTEKPDAGKLRALQKEINGLKAEMAEKRLTYRLETRKVAPEGTYGGGCGRGRGGYGRNWGGPCWN
jgi:hypothetical protein